MADLPRESNRELVYRFMNLPFSLRLEVLKNIGVFQETEMKIPEIEMFKNAFGRIKDKNLLHKMQTEIAQIEERRCSR